MSRTVTFEMPVPLKEQLKQQAKKNGMPFKAYCNAILKDAVQKDVMVAFSLVTQSGEPLKLAASFSEQTETPEIED